MAVNLSPVGGVAAQFFTNSGAPLTGGKIFTYAAGTTTPQASYTTSQGNVAWTNPIVLDAAGRVPSGGEIWLTDGLIYKFILKDANDVLIATYDNITGINSNSVAFVNQQEIITATAGQTVFNLGISYQPGTNSLSVFVDGVNQYGPGAQYAYTETDSDTVTFTTGLHVGAEVKFTTTQQQSAGAVDAQQVSYQPPFTGSVATNVEAKLREILSVLDFGADPTGVADSTTAIQNAINAAIAANGDVYFPAGTYNYAPAATFDITISGDGLTLKGDIGRSFIKTDFNGVAFNVVTNFRATVNFLGSAGLNLEGLYFENQNYATTNTNATCFYVTRGIEFGALCNISDCTFGRYTNCAVQGIRAWNWSVKRSNFYGVAFRDSNPPWPTAQVEAGIRLWGADGTLTVQDHSFSNLCLIENCNFQYLYQGIELWGSSVTNNIQDCTFQFLTIGINVYGDSTLSGMGSAATKAGFGSNLGVVTSNNCWFEQVWRGVIGAIVNSTTGLIYGAGTYPGLPGQTQGSVRGNVAQNFDTLIPADSYFGILHYVPVTEGVIGSGYTVRYWNAQTQSVAHYRFYSDEFYVNAPAEFTSTVTTTGITEGTVGDNNSAFRGNTTFASYAGTVYESNTTRAGNVAFNHFTCVSNNVVVNATLGNGDVVNLNNSYGAISDAKVKENIVDATPKLNDICKLQVRNFNLISDPNKRKQIGLIAQEAETVFPGLVEKIQDKDENGDLLDTSTKNIKYSVLVPMLVKAVQELKAELDALKSQ